MTGLLDVRNLDAGYGEVAILHGVSFSAAEGAITALIGSNGSGKTTTMRAIAGLLPARSGSIDFDDRDLTRARPSERVEAGIALVPEGRLIFPEFTVEGAATRLSDYELAVEILGCRRLKAIQTLRCRNYLVSRTVPVGCGACRRRGYDTQRRAADT